MKRVSSLDGLRAIAIISVVIAHCWHVEAGTLGVDLFFVLSGYLITNLLIQEWKANRHISLRAFYRRRALRLLPALSLMLTAFASYQVFVVHSGWRGPLDALIGLSYAANFIAPNLISPGLGHLWSLAIEEQFYIVWPVVIVALLSRLRWRPLTWFLIAGGFAVVVVAYVVGPDLGPLATWSGTNVHLAPLLFGCAVATARAGGKAHISGRKVSVALGLMIPTVVLFGTPDAYVLVPVFGACAATLMLALLERPDGLAARALSARPLGVIGRTSYGIYLWHYPLLSLTGHDVPLTLLLTAVAVTLSYRFVEQPLLRIAKRPRRFTLPGVPAPLVSS